MTGSLKKIRFGLIVLFVLVGGISEAQVRFDLSSNYKYLKGSAAPSLPGGWMTDIFDDSGWVNYDDGFVIWINGVKVLTRNAPATLTSASLSTANHECGKQ